ncbi:MAG: DUF1127 domain-containing protein [Gammaproteobacteria bacterium]|nr:DUF1127 domain-containing protein [Gammaproteobacteria bacterium]
MSTLTYEGLSIRKHETDAIGEKWKQLQAFVWSCYRRHSQRRQLCNLSDHLLKDIGISRVDALREAHKHFWQE